MFLQVSAIPEIKTTTWKDAGQAREQLQSPYTKHSCTQESVSSELCVGTMIQHAYMNKDVWICFPQRKSFITMHPFCASSWKRKSKMNPRNSTKTILWVLLEAKADSYQKATEAKDELTYQTEIARASCRVRPYQLCTKEVGLESVVF